MSDQSMPTGSHLPTVTMNVLRRRAKLLEQARLFFLNRGYWEVETPLLSADTCIDAHIDPISLTVDGEVRFLQTSPEFAMKRLLVAGSGSIFQIAHAFRAGESGNRHNREFTLIEWYKLGATYHELMVEVSEFASHLAGWPEAEKLTYREAFMRETKLDPLLAPEDGLWELARCRGLSSRPVERDDLLNFLWADLVEPTLGLQSPLFIHDYPASQAALAKVREEPDGTAIAERFELYVNGVELCNGYQELSDATELRKRFERQNELRIVLGKSPLPVESRLIQAMKAGLPDCAGVALGFERLMMLLIGTNEIKEVLPFPDSRA
ncbi:EF-P lysine aminoacylase GenX [bacterium]|nr:EF-P lysine aminoacylase GenX [bacterium]